MRMGLLGCGRIGKVHGANISAMDGVELVAVADAMEDAAQALAHQHGAQVRDPLDICAANDVDAVMICTPTTTHYDLIHAAAQGGKAIFCEKPIDLSTARAAECLSIVTAKNVPFMTAFQRRFDPSFADLERRLRAGEIGTPELIILTSRDPSPPPVSYIETSGGIFRDMIIHDLDIARFFLAEEPSEVHATGACHTDPGIGDAGDVDTAAVTLKTPSGKICQINASRRAVYGYDQRAEVLGEGGMLRIENRLQNSVERAGEGGFTRAPTLHFFLDRYADAYRIELAHFVEAVGAGKSPSPSAEDGLRAQKLADAAQTSLDEGRVVTL
ncbi:MAG: inositol 2-dehydrogenase [Pseudomonadota bacterium]